MKKIFILNFILIAIFLQAQSGNVGINTNNPQAKLHVNGNFQSDRVVLGSTFTKLINNENYSFLIKSPAPENKITSYNSLFDTENAPAPLNLIQYKITTSSSDKDWINRFDTKINANKYVVVIASFGFNLPVSSSSSDLSPYYPVHQIYAQIDSTTNTWILKADYDSFRPNGSGDGVWTLNLLVFDRAYANLMSTVNVNLNSNTTGSANSALIQ